MAWEDENDEVRDINDGYVMSMPCIRELHGLCGVTWCVCHCHEVEEGDLSRFDGRGAADLTKHGQKGL